MSSSHAGASGPNNDAYAQELHLCITQAFGGRVTSLSVEVTDEEVVLSGGCDSFHTKQLVQELARTSTSRRVISNLIVVRRET